jgi:D-arabinose 1-dehydrogenase-like Zn-dependent alcohol dehydrogenase
MPGDLVAVLGVGGLGHLGIQFANKFGYKVVAIGRGSESAALAKKLLVGDSWHVAPWAELTAPKRRSACRRRQSLF